MSKKSQLSTQNKSSGLEPHSQSLNPQKTASNIKDTPRTMAELLAKTGYQLTALKRGQQITGTVVDILPREVIIDVGAKSEGIISGKEFDLSADLISGLKVGDKVTANVVYPENDAGQIVLSLRRTGSEMRWEQLFAKKEGEEMLEVRGVEVNRGGLVVDYLGLRGFVPSSQLSQENIGQAESLVGKTLMARVVEADRATNRLIFSQRPAVAPEDLAKKLSKIKIGEACQAVVTAVLPFGLFATVTGLEGLVHISELSWEKVTNPAELFKVGDKVKVLVLSIDQENGRLNLSIKQLTEDPWKKIAEKFTKEQRVTGAVTRLTPFGAFVSLAPRVDGLLHISKIPPDFNINVGDNLDCTIESVDLQSRRISLSLILKEKPVGYR